MRLMRVSRAYESYLHDFSRRQPNASTLDYDSLRHLYYGDAFGTSDAWTAALEALGYETFAAVANCETLQKAWAREHGVDVTGGSWPRQILLAQARHFRPEVVWLNVYDRDLVRALRREVPGLRLIFQGVGGHIDLSFPFRELDFLISCAPELVATLRGRDIPAHHIDHAFDPRVLERLSPRAPAVHDITFCGQLVADPGVHTARQALLSRLAAECPIEIFTADLVPRASGRLGSEALWRGLAGPVQWAVARGVPAALVQRVPKIRTLLDLRLSRSITPRLRPAVYGLAMYETVRRSRISLNVHPDSSPTHASNQRLYEVTGAGTCLLTDWKANLPDLFEPDREVATYRTAGEGVEKIRWLLAHPAEREAIARAGHQRCLAQHTHAHRAPLVDGVIREALARLPGSRHRVGLAAERGQASPRRRPSTDHPGAHSRADGEAARET